MLRDRTLRAVTLVAAVIWVFILPFETVVLNAYPAGDRPGRRVRRDPRRLRRRRHRGRAGLRRDRPSRCRPGPTLVGALALAGLSLGAFALLPAIGVMIVLAVLAGIVTGPINPVCAVIIQSRTPERLRGRVIGSYTALALAAGPLGLLAFGPLVDAFGPAVGFLLIGVGLRAGGRAGGDRPAVCAASAGPSAPALPRLGRRQAVEG